MFKDEQLDFKRLFQYLESAKDPSNLENQKRFIACCFRLNLAISNSLLELTDLPTHMFEVQRVLTVINKFRKPVFESATPMTEGMQLLTLNCSCSIALDFVQFKNLMKLTIEGTLFEMKEVEKLLNLRELRISRLSKYRQIDIKLPRLLTLDIYANQTDIFHQDLSQLPLLRQLSIFIELCRLPFTIVNMPRSIKKASFQCWNSVFTLSSIFTITQSYNSLTELTMEGVNLSANIPSLKHMFPMVKSLDIFLSDLMQYDSLDFASILPQTICSLVIRKSKFKNTLLDFSGLPNLTHLKLVETEFTVSNVVWGTSITNLKLVFRRVSFEDTLVIGNGILNQLQHLLLRRYAGKLVFGPDSMLQTLYMNPAKTPRDNLCMNLKYLEVLQDNAFGTRFYSPAFEKYNNLRVCMDFRYADAAEYESTDVGMRLVNAQSSLDMDDIINYTYLKEAYGLRNDILVFVSLP